MSSAMSTVKLLRNCLFSSLILILIGVDATSVWNFDEAIISVTSMSGKAFKDKLSDNAPLANPVVLGTLDTLKIILTATEDGVGKRPHQAFLLLRDQDSGLEASYTFSVKANGKGKLEISQKDFPTQLKISSQPLRCTLLLASFGSSEAFGNHVFNLDVKVDPYSAKPDYVKPLRYGKREEIHHIFKPEHKSGPIIISIFFTLAITLTIPVLFSYVRTELDSFITTANRFKWAYLGANLSHLPKAIKVSPIAHFIFFGSILGIEGLLFLYYYKWNLFQVLPMAGIIGLAAFLSGPKALSEVQGRRLSGER